MGSSTIRRPSLASKFFETAKFYSLTEHNFSPLAIYFSETPSSAWRPKLREGFLDAATKAAVDTRATASPSRRKRSQMLQTRASP